MATVEQVTEELRAVVVGGREEILNVGPARSSFSSEQNAISLVEWSELGRPSCLDVRETAAFENRRLANSRGIPFEHVKMRLMELPPRHLPIFIVAGEFDEWLLVKAFFDDRNFIAAKVLCTEAPGFWEKAEEIGCLLRGPPGKDEKPPMLFRPSDTLMEWADVIEENVKLAINDDSVQLFSADIGCGSGRDAVFLARRGWEVSGVDEFEKALGRMMKLAGEHGVSDTVHRYQCHIKADGSLEGEDLFANRQYHLVVVVRFLQKQFLPKVAELVAPGGFVLYETFAEEGAESEPTGHKRMPKAGRLLSTDELFVHFPEKDFKVFHCKLRTLEDARRLRCFVAQKRISSNEENEIVVRETPSCGS